MLTNGPVRTPGRRYPAVHSRCPVACRVDFVGADSCAQRSVMQSSRYGRPDIARVRYVPRRLGFHAHAHAQGARCARRSQPRDVGTRVKPCIVVGIIVAGVPDGGVGWVATQPSPYSYVSPALLPEHAARDSHRQVVSPAAAIGLALLVLSRIERNAALPVFTLGYLASCCSRSRPDTVRSYRTDHLGFSCPACSLKVACCCSGV